MPFKIGVDVTWPVS